MSNFFSGNGSPPKISAGRGAGRSRVSRIIMLTSAFVTSVEQCKDHPWGKIQFKDRWLCSVIPWWVWFLFVTGLIPKLTLGCFAIVCFFNTVPLIIVAAAANLVTVRVFILNRRKDILELTLMDFIYYEAVVIHLLFGQMARCRPMG